MGVARFHNKNTMGRYTIMIEDPDLDYSNIINGLKLQCLNKVTTHDHFGNRKNANRIYLCS